MFKIYEISIKIRQKKDVIFRFAFIKRIRYKRLDAFWFSVRKIIFKKGLPTNMEIL